MFAHVRGISYDDKSNQPLLNVPNCSTRILKGCATCCLMMLPNPAPALFVQPWYENLEGLRHLLPDEDAKDKAVGEAWPSRLQRMADRQLATLEEDEKKWVI